MRKILLPLLLLGLAGCSMVQSNVKGGFSCGAPRGTCAPSTAIDDAALHAIDSHKPDPEAATTSTLSPDETAPKEASADTVSATGRGALKVIYPAWRDSSGHVHKRTVAYVNVDAPGLVGANDVPHAADSPKGTNLLAVAEAAPDLALVSPSPAPTSGQDAVTPAQAAAAPAQPTADVPQPAAAGSTTPLGAIQAQVRDILAHAPKPALKPAAPAVAMPAPGVPAPPVSPASATPGGTFPPQGE